MAARGAGLGDGCADRARSADRAARKAVGAELAGTGLHTGQELVLTSFLHGSLPVAKLAKVLDVEVRPHPAHPADRGRRPLRRVKSSTDARQVGIELTDRGVELAHTVQEVYDLGRPPRPGHADPEDRRLLRNLLWTITHARRQPLARVDHLRQQAHGFAQQVRWH